MLPAHENFFDEPGLIDNVDARVEQPKSRDRSVAPRSVRQERQDAGRGAAAEEAQRFPSARSRRHDHVAFDVPPGASVAAAGPLRT